MPDLHVVGAGPVGCIAAISSIRKRNTDVIVSEEHECAGIPMHCSGLFSVDGLSALSEFVDYRKTTINPMRGAVIDFAGERFTVRAKKDVAYVCDRAKFDALLAENAEKEGAKIKFKERICNSAQFTSKNIIGADGPNSFVASHFGFPHIKRFVSTMQANVRYEAEDAHSVEIFLSRSKFPGFFGWIIPHDEENAEFGCGVALPNNAGRAFDTLLKMNGIRKNISRSGSIIPISIRPKTAMRKNSKNILLIGDAAGQVKATTGGGVIFGGNCARMAGEYFNEPHKYENGWRGEFGFDLMIHSMVRGYLNGKSDAELKKLSARLKTSGLETFLSKHGHMDKPTKMIGLGLLRSLFGI